MDDREGVPLTARVQLALYLLSAALCLAFALPRLQFSSDRTRMLRPDHPEQQRYEKLRQVFDRDPEIVALVLCDDAEVRHQAAGLLASRMQTAVAFIDNAAWPRQGLYYLPADRLDQLLAELKASQPALQALAQRRWTELTQRQGGTPGVGEQWKQALDSRGRAPYRSPWGPPPPALDTRRYLDLTPSTTAVIWLSSQPPGDDQLKGWKAEVESRFADTRVEWAGELVAVRDDGVRARQTAVQVSLISLVLVHVFFRWAFGHPLPARLALLSVAVGLSWSCAWVALAVPELNVITINFAATLIGLGMDFHIHWLFRSREEGGRAVARETLVGALATSLAFASLIFTPFVGIRQLGTINSVGVMLCWVASMTVLPCLMKVWPPPQAAPSRLPLVRAPLGLVAVVTLVLLWKAPQAGFDANVLHMMSPRSANTRLDHLFHREAHHCSLFAASLATDESDMRRRVRAFRALPSVARVESLHDWMPTSSPGQQQRIEQLIGLVGQLPVLSAWDGRLSNAELLQLRDIQPDSSLGPGPVQDALQTFLGGLHQDLRLRLQWLRQQEARPPAWDELPQPWLQRYRREGVWLVKIYPRECIWDPANMNAFIAQARTVDAQVSGRALLIMTYLEELHRSYWQAGRNALAAIALLLLITYRQLGWAALAVLPKLLGMVWMLGALGWLGILFNPANATALPLTLGIGLVFGIHVVHDYQQGRGLAPSTQRAVLVSGLSTMLGYVALVTADYPGVASLGVVMALGVGSNLIAALWVLPAVLDRTVRNR